MKDLKKQELREQFIELYLQGKTMQEISKLTNCSRNFIGKVIKEDDRIKEYRNKKTVKVSKLKKQHKMVIPISVDFLTKIGISDDVNLPESVDITVDENRRIITIKKHKI